MVFRSSDGASPAGGPEPLAAARSLLPAAAALGHRQEVHGGLRAAGAGAARPDARAGESDASSRPPTCLSTPQPPVCVCPLTTAAAVLCLLEGCREAEEPSRRTSQEQSSGGAGPGRVEEQ